MKLIIRGTQRHSEALRGTQRHSEALHSSVIIRNQRGRHPILGSMMRDAIIGRNT